MASTGYTIDDFSKGDQVYFGRGKGEQTLGEVIKVNRAKLKVKTLESRGTQRSYAVGSVWTVPPSLCCPVGAAKQNTAVFIPAPTPAKVPTAAAGILVGDRVWFTNGRKGKVFGTVECRNPKTYTLEDCSDGPRGWRVNPLSIRKVGPNDVDPGAATPPVKNAAVDRDIWETFAPSAGLPKDAFGKTFTLRGKVYRITGFNLRARKYPVNAVCVTNGKEIRFTSGSVIRALPAAPKRAEFTILDEIASCYIRLENLSTDARRPDVEVRSRRTQLNRDLKALFAELGRELSETEVWDALERATA